MQSKSLRQILTTITLIGLAPMAALLCLLIYQSYVAAKQGAIDSLRATTSAVANQYQLYLADTERQFQYLADVPDITNGSRADCEAWMAKNILMMPGLSAWYRIDMEGLVTCASKAVTANRRLDATFNPEAGDRFGRVDIVPVRKSKTTNQYVLGMRKAYENNGQPFQMVVAYDAQWFLDAVESVSPMTAQRLFLLDENGTVLLQLPNYANTPKGRIPTFEGKIKPADVPIMHNVKKGVGGDTRIATSMTAHQFSDGRRIYLSFSMAPDTLFASANRVVVLGLGVLVLGVLGVVIAQHFLFRRYLSKPINSIVHFATQTAQHGMHEAVNLPSAAPTQLVEIATAIEDMATQSDQRAAALSEARDNLQRAEEIARIGHWRLDLKTNQCEWSDGVYMLHGLSRDSYTPNLETAINHYHPEDRDDVAKTIEAAQATGKAYSFEKRIIRSDGSHLFVHSRGQVTFDKAGEPAAMFGIITDIDAPKQAERELKRAQVAAQQLADARAAFLASVSHEVRTPLTAMLGIVEGLRDTELTPEVLAQLDLLDAAGQMLANVIADVLDSASIDSGKIRLLATPTDIEALLNQCYATFQTAYTTPDITFEQRMVGRPPKHVAIDAQRVRQVVFNLLSNAFKHTQAGRIRVTSAFTDTTMSIMVEDSGPGIHPYHQTQLFDRFNNSGPSGKDQRPGTGLGLYIVKSIVNEMAGDITVKSALGEGSCFTVTLPYGRLEDTLAEAAHKAGSDTEVAAAPPMRNAARHVLVVEDHPVNQKLFSAFLDKLGCPYTIQKDGQCALEWLLARRGEDLPAMILVDVNMPRLNGIELCEFIRTQLPGGESQALYLVTADVLDDYESCITRLNINGYLSKPIDFDNLRAVIGQHVDLSALQPAA
ncbi:MAG: ATP-binding protein [Pseudomonadota bacterium]